MNTRNPPAKPCPGDGDPAGDGNRLPLHRPFLIVCTPGSAFFAHRRPGKYRTAGGGKIQPAVSAGGVDPSDDGSSEAVFRFGLKEAAGFPRCHLYRYGGGKITARIRLMTAQRALRRPQPLRIPQRSVLPRQSLPRRSRPKHPVRPEPAAPDTSTVSSTAAPPCRTLRKKAGSVTLPIGWLAVLLVGAVLAGGTGGGWFCFFSFAAATSPQGGVARDLPLNAPRGFAAAQSPSQPPLCRLPCRMSDAAFPHTARFLVYSVPRPFLHCASRPGFLPPGIFLPVSLILCCFPLPYVLYCIHNRHERTGTR